MKYTEKVMIVNAIADAVTYIERADTLLDDLIHPYFETIEPSEEMLRHVRYDYNSVSNLLYTISDALAQALFELHAFTEEDGGRTKYLIDRAEKLKAIINTKREG